MNNRLFTKVATFPLIVAVASTASLAQAQPVERAGILEEVIVKAQRRAEASVDVPITITTLDSELLSDAGATQLSDIGELTPGLRFDASSAFTQPTIRGIGNSVVSSGSTSNVGIYVDGFYVPNPVAVDFQLMSLENVQVLKGPQGTLFGRNTTGGAILVSSAKPSHESRGVVELSYGNYDEHRVGVYGTTGLTDSIAVDVEGNFESGDGYWDNIITGNDDDAGFDNWTGRVGLTWDISERASLLLRYVRHDVDDGRSLAYNAAKIDGQFVVPGFIPESLYTGEPDKISVQLPIGFTSETDALQATFEYEMDFATLTSYTQHRKDDSQILIDNDGTGFNIAQLEINLEDTTFSQEFLLTSNSDGPLQWTAGLFYFDYEDNYIPFRIRFAPDDPFMLFGGSTTTTKTLAAYLDTTYQLTDRFFVTVGLRYSRDEVEDAKAFDDSPDVFAPVPVDDYSDNQVTPRVVLRYELNDTSSIYGSYTQGYKAGFLDVPNPPPVEKVKPEKIDAFEVGYKYSGPRVSLETAAFYYDYEDLQVSRYPQGTAITVNAATASIKGLEGQIRYSATDNLQITAGLAWTDAEYDDFPNYANYQQLPDGNFFPIDTDVSGREMQRAPELTGTLTARYETDLADGLLALSGNLYYSSDFYFDGAEKIKEGNYTTLGLRAAWTNPSQRYTLALFGRNVTDEEYRVAVNETFTGPTAVWAAPATYGASVRVNF